MLSNRLAFIAVGFACVVAAGGGSYFATRHNAVDQFAAPTSAASPTTASTSAVAPDVTAPMAAIPPAPVTESVQVARPAEAAPVTTRSSAAPATVATNRSVQVARGSATTKRNVPDAQPPARIAQRSEPSGSVQESAPPANTASATPAEPPAAQRPEERVAAEAQTPAAPPQATFQELVVAADSVIGLQTETTLSSERARIEDRVEARVARDVRVGGRVAIPAGSRALGSVVVVERGGKLKERARLGIRFHTLALADGTRLPISTETIYRYGDAPGDASAKKIGGGAVAGAILGAIIGGGKGAAIGATAGAAGGGAVVMNGDRSEAVFQSGAEVTARIVSPVTVTIER